MTLAEFWSLRDKQKIAIHCDTEEQACKLLSAFRDMGATWCSGEPYSPHDAHWCSENGGTCYTNRGTRANLRFYLTEDMENCRVISCDDIEDVVYDSQIEISAAQSQFDALMQ